MKIDRHNYEEYLVLYIDNELTVDERKQVELFVKDNADLEEELIMLQQSRLIPDDNVIFNEKHLLMKEVGQSSINMNNYEEWLVLYVDNELTEEQKITVDRFAAAHPNVQQELALFQQTILQPEKIILETKDVLYRREKPKVIVMQWWRVAVAAVVIVAAGITLYSISHTSNNFNTRTATRETVANKKDEPVTSAKPVSTDQQQSAQNDQRKDEQVAVTNPMTKSKTQQKQPLRNLKRNQPNNTLRSPETQQIIAEIPKEKTVRDNTIDAEINPPQINNAVTLNDKKVDTLFNKKAVTTEPAQTLNTVEVASNTENKRFRGFFRKATRLIERTTNINPTDNDDRVLIGGVAINLK